MHLRATVAVVRGQASSRVVAPDSDCNAWSDSGGAWFSNLVPNVAMTMRASAPGYVDLEKTVIANGLPGQATIFELDRAKK